MWWYKKDASMSQVDTPEFRSVHASLNSLMIQLELMDNALRWEIKQSERERDGGSGDEQ